MTWFQGVRIEAEGSIYYTAKEHLTIKCLCDETAGIQYIHMDLLLST